MEDFELEGLTFGKSMYDGVFISHHHGDHCGLVKKVLKDIPIYAGKETQRILSVVSDFIKGENVKIDYNIISGQPLTIKDITITPISVSHSAKDAYMFFVESNGKSLLYTGDYKNTLEVQNHVKKLLGDRKLDLMISEGTNINADRTVMQSEVDLKNEVIELMENYNGTVFVLCSTANEERVNVLLESAKVAERVSCEDLFMTILRDGKDEDVQSFQAYYIEKDKNKNSPTYKYFNGLYKERKLVGAETLANLPNKKMIFIRSSMLPFIKRYLRYRPNEEKNLLIYSMWNGYKESLAVKKLLEVCYELKIDVVDCHCSGHAYRDGLESFIKSINPKVLVPIHCEKRDRDKFLEIHDNCKNISDGEIFEI